eukprot:TRINITY_DN483_c0_g1_i1.p1 TRINITY_DN483_c0_g1~~TRINITY_DN483_c0_g1_i1.p1  ORF type:complete len:289 (-),score=19.77 TRINITY_DN483_c0_g1_i1:44-910(-)
MRYDIIADVQLCLACFGLVAVLMVFIVSARFPSLASFPGSLLLLASFFDALFSLKFVLVHVNGDAPSAALCTVMAAYGQLTASAAVGYHTIWGFHTLLQLVRRSPPPKQIECAYHTLAWIVVATELAVLLTYARDRIGRFVDGTCYVKDSYLGIVFALYLGPLIFSLALCLVSLGFCLHKLFKGAHPHRQLMTHHVLYLMVFIVCWGLTLAGDICKSQLTGIATVLAAPFLALIRLFGPDVPTKQLFSRSPNLSKYSDTLGLAIPFVASFSDFYSSSLDVTLLERASD